MDVAQFLKTSVKTEAPASEAPASAEPTAVKTYRDTTPSGIVVEYCPDPRGYKVNGVEVPSVTTVLDVLRKDGLSWWGMKVGVEGVLELFKRKALHGHLDWQTGEEYVALIASPEVAKDDPANHEFATVDNVVKALTSEKLTVNHALSKAGDRGTNVHQALEDWARSGGEYCPTPQKFVEEEQPYVHALLKWLDDVDGAAKVVGVETMVGSAEHGFAGRFDLTVELWEQREFILKAYKRKESKKVIVEPGRYLVDAKTSSGVYTSHHLQLAAYELAAIEGGYEPTDGQFVLHLTKDGAYEFVPSQAKGADFLAVKAAYDRLKVLP